MKELIEDVGNWSKKAFGEHDRIEDIFRHLKSEADEAILYHKEDSPFMDWAYADCLILLFDGMNRQGISWDKVMVAVKAKMEVNKRKDWSKQPPKDVCESCLCQDTSVCMGCPLPYEG